MSFLKTKCTWQQHAATIRCSLGITLKEKTWQAVRVRLLIVNHYFPYCNCHELGQHFQTNPILTMANDRFQPADAENLEASKPEARLRAHTSPAPVVVSDL